MLLHAKKIKEKNPYLFLKKQHINQYKITNKIKYNTVKHDLSQFHEYRKCKK